MYGPKVQLLLDILNEIWEGADWIDPLGLALEGWSNEQAQIPFAPGLNSVETIVNHTAFWEEVALRLLRGQSLKDLSPLDAAKTGKAPAWMPPWPQAVDRFKKIRVQLHLALLDCDDAYLSKRRNRLTVETSILSMCIHSSYHAGQLALLRQLFKLPDLPRRSVAFHLPAPGGARSMLLKMMDIGWSRGYSIDPFEELTRTLTPELVNWRPREDIHTITEIINHMRFWEEYVTRRLRGESVEDMPSVGLGGIPPGMPNWPKALEDLIRQHRELHFALEALSDEELSKPRPGRGKQFEGKHAAQWLVYGVIIHHAYHVGQIVPLALFKRE